MNKNNIELKLVNNNVDLNSINAIQLISFIPSSVALESTTLESE